MAERNLYVYFSTLTYIFDLFPCRCKNSFYRYVWLCKWKDQTKNNIFTTKANKHVNLFFFIIKPSIQVVFETDTGVTFFHNVCMRVFDGRWGCWICGAASVFFLSAAYFDEGGFLINPVAPYRPVTEHDTNKIYKYFFSSFNLDSKISEDVFYLGIMARKSVVP